MPEDFLAAQFEANRTHLTRVAYRMLGSTAEADDAVQEAWLRLSRSVSSEIENLPGWLTTVTERICLNMLRSRATRREDEWDGHLPDPIITKEGDPSEEAELADSVGLALLVVLEVLPPAERLAFVLHDLFAVPFVEIGEIVDRSPEAARQLASRARRRVRGARVPDPDVSAQRSVVSAFYRAARGGDMQTLLSLLDPNVVLRADGGTDGSQEVRGADQVAANAAMFATPDRTEHPVLVNGQAAAVIQIDDKPTAVMAFTVTDGVIVAIDVFADPTRIGGVAIDLRAGYSGKFADRDRQKGCPAGS
jgi:RNA polymerase sigma factor (sigma-70 family)